MVFAACQSFTIFQINNLVSRNNKTLSKIRNRIFKLSFIVTVQATFIKFSSEIRTNINVNVTYFFVTTFALVELTPVGILCHQC